MADGCSSEMVTQFEKSEAREQEKDFVCVVVIRHVKKSRRSTVVSVLPVDVGYTQRRLLECQESKEQICCVPHNCLLFAGC